MVHEIKNMPKLVPVTVEQAPLEISKKNLLQKGSLNGYKVATIIILGVATGLAAAAAAVAAVFAAYLITGLCAAAFVIGLTATICASKIKISPKWAKQQIDYKNQFVTLEKDHEKAITENQSIIENLNNQIKSLNQENDTLKLELIKKKSVEDDNAKRDQIINDFNEYEASAKKMLEQKENEIKNLQKQLENTKKELSNVPNRRNLKETDKKVETALEKQKEATALAFGKTLKAKEAEIVRLQLQAEEKAKEQITLLENQIKNLKKAKEDDRIHSDEIINQKNEEISRLKRELEELNAKKMTDLEKRIPDLEKTDVDQPTENDEQQNDEFAKLKNQLTINPVDIENLEIPLQEDTKADSNEITIPTVQEELISKKEEEQILSDIPVLSEVINN